MTTYCALIFILRICTHLYDCNADVHLRVYDRIAYASTVIV